MLREFTWNVYPYIERVSLSNVFSPRDSEEMRMAMAGRNTSAAVLSPAALVETNIIYGLGR